MCTWSKRSTLRQRWLPSVLIAFSTSSRSRWLLVCPLNSAHRLFVGGRGFTTAALRGISFQFFAILRLACRRSSPSVGFDLITRKRIEQKLLNYNAEAEQFGGKFGGLCYSYTKLNKKFHNRKTSRHVVIIEAKKGNPPIMPAVMTPGGPLDLSNILFRNRIIFIGQPVNSQVAQRVISQLVTLAAVDDDADILIYLNCPGGSTYSILAIYDCMSWIKPKVGTVCFGVAASQGVLLLAGGEKGMRYAMPNSRIMIHQPQSGCGGHVEDVRRQVKEAVQSRHKIDKMYAAFTGQPLEKVQQYTERDRFFSASEALEFGLIDGVLETEY